MLYGEPIGGNKATRQEAVPVTGCPVLRPLNCSLQPQSGLRQARARDETTATR